MGAEAFHNYAASFVAQHLHPLQFPKTKTSQAAKAATTGSKAGPTTKPSTPAPTRPAPAAQQKPMTQADRDDWAQAMGNRLKRKHEAADQAHHDYLMNRSGEVLNRVQRERRAQYGSGPASDLLHTFNRRMDDIQGQTKPTGSSTPAPGDMIRRAAAVKKSGIAKEAGRADLDPHGHETRINNVHDGMPSPHRLVGPIPSPTDAPTPKASAGSSPVGSEKVQAFHVDDVRSAVKDTHGPQFTGSAPSASSPKRAAGGYRAKAAHEGAWDGTFPHQEPVDLSGFDHAPVKDAPAQAAPSSDHFTSAARNVKFNGTMKEVGREGSDPGASRITARFTRHDGAPANWPMAGKQRAAQHGLFPVNQVKKVGRTKAPKPEAEHDPRTPGPGQTSLDFGHDSSAQVHNPKQFGQQHLF